jgi:hypothetical protein
MELHGKAHSPCKENSMNPYFESYEDAVKFPQMHYPCKHCDKITKQKMLTTRKLTGDAWLRKFKIMNDVAPAANFLDLHGKRKRHGKKPPLTEKLMKAPGNIEIKTQK